MSKADEPSGSGGLGFARNLGRRMSMASSFSKANSKLRKTFSSAILSPPRETHQKIARKQKSYYERLTYFLDILVADDEPDTMLVPAGSIMQHVKYGKNDRWRVIKDENGVLPAYLVDHRPKDPDYVVPVEDAGIFPIFDLTSNFLKRWDMLSLILLLFTASVTPFETAFIHNDTGIDLLWLINRCVDIVFFLDMFVQIRTPYRDQQTGRLVRDGKAILSRYVKSWFLIDLLSIIPFEMINQSSGSNSKNLSQLRLLRFLRLARLLKLLRVLRASRKLKQWRVYINLRYATLKLVQFSVIILFMIHWIACGYRLAEDPNDPSDPQGWLSNYANYRNVNITSLGIMEPYILALYWASSTITLVGPSFDQIAPTTVRETGYSLFANFVAYFLALYLISSLTNVLSVANRLETEHDLRVDNYLEMFQRLKLDPRLKVKVHQYLSDHYAAAATQAYTNLLGELPAQLHGFITMEIFVDFIARVPYLEPFIDREPNLTHEICRGVLIQTIPANAHVFTEGYQGIYFLEHGIVAIDGRVYPSGSVFGRTCLRAFPKRNECRALTNVTIHYLPLTVLRSALSKYPKIMYYAKRWTVWQLLRRYVFTYTTLYYTAAKRGARMVPPLTSMRPGLREGEYDDIDLAVLEHINEFGY